MIWCKRPSCLLTAGQRRLARYTNRRLIEVGALEALVYAAQGNEAAALAALRQAVDLAAPGGALRLLVDCGPGVIGLLLEAANGRRGATLHPTSPGRL